MNVKSRFLSKVQTSVKSFADGSGRMWIGIENEMAEIENLTQSSRKPNGNCTAESCRNVSLAVELV